MPSNLNRTVWLCAFTTKCAVCMLAHCLGRDSYNHWCGMAVFPIFYAVIENDSRHCPLLQ